MSLEKIISSREEMAIHRQIALHNYFRMHGFKPSDTDKMLEINVSVPRSFAKMRAYKGSIVVSDAVDYTDCDEFRVRGVNGHLIYPDKNISVMPGIYVPNSPANNKKFNIPSYQDYFSRAIIENPDFAVSLDEIAYLVAHDLKAEDLKTIPYLCPNAKKYVGIVEDSPRDPEAKSNAKLLKMLGDIINQYTTEKYKYDEEDITVRSRTFRVRGIYPQSKK